MAAPSQILGAPNTRALNCICGEAAVFAVGDLGAVDLGYRFLPAYWGQGLATEASIACLNYGFDTLGLQRILGLTHPDNLASMRVLEKVGMRRTEPILYEGVHAERFEIHRKHHEDSP